MNYDNSILIRIYPGDDSSETLKEWDVYLLPDYDYVEQMEKWLKKHYDGIFMDQLNNWVIDETYWPQKRTFKMFKEWFEFTLNTGVWDTERTFIDKV